jgi:hypothetical protein
MNGEAAQLQKRSVARLDEMESWQKVTPKRRYGRDSKATASLVPAACERKHQKRLQLVAADTA